MNTSEILRTVAHRELPPPKSPWVMAQTWLDLLFAHWPLSLDVLRPHIPDMLDIDTFEQQAWVGVVPFRMRDVHPRWIPSVNGISHFPELNVRTYVTYKGYPSVYFFSLEAANPLAVAIARSVFHLPYFNARMTCEHQGDTIYYSSHRTHRGAMPADYLAKYRPIAPIEYAGRGTIASGIHFRLRARAFIVAEPNGNRVVFVNLDACMASQIVKIKVIERLKARY